MNNRIREVRQHEHLSMKSFGDRIGISSASVSKIETGINNPSEQTIRAICSEFHVSRLWLEQGIGEMKEASTLIPDLVRILRQYPALQNALEGLLDVMGPEEWAMLNKVVAKAIAANEKGAEE